jgi:predicted LPLAT superfamily acyltransferase
MLYDRGDVSYTSEGMEHLERAIREKTGGIILMSHVGNWEIAAHLLRRTGLRLMLYMGIKNKEQIERVQKQSLEETGIKIIAVEQEEGSPFDLIEGIDFIRGGGLVSLTGDRLWRSDQRALAVNFLGHRARLPETPHLFALLWERLFSPSSRFERKKDLPFQHHTPSLCPRRCAQREGRGDLALRTGIRGPLAETARAHPFEWYHFEPFIERETDDAPSSRKKS